ncbi:hypothetical protein BJF79_32400 [Actinomadura sp. CNU-125]|uniref:hypothetical protein n=1 Tax=Actinomadura sp. CNU-125 TaxID=1904961 RepID=UPI000960D64C|nr:hypothetical protein [Actinomadura sp. CNU-125]OLT35461.1 hypothetical protein BJF79_32400 [Actinomadura sp. CNU-125]
MKATLYGVLAEAPGSDGAESFLDSSIGGAFERICGAVGIVIAVVCIFRMVNHMTRGKPGEGFKVFFFGLVLGGLLFDLSLTVNGIDSVSGLVGRAFDSIDSVTG